MLQLCKTLAKKFLPFAKLLSKQFQMLLNTGNSLIAGSQIFHDSAQIQSSLNGAGDINGKQNGKPQTDSIGCRKWKQQNKSL